MFVLAHGFVPLDLVARRGGIPQVAARRRVDRLCAEGWLELVFPKIEPYPWVGVTTSTYWRLDHRKPPRRPSTSSIAHRRGVISTRLELEERYPEGKWISEGQLLDGNRRPGECPDGQFQVNGEVWAVEVEISYKSNARVRNKVKRMLGTYQRVIYMCSSGVVPLLKEVAAQLDDDRLEIRLIDLPEWLMSPVPRRLPEHPGPISSTQRKLLVLISEEGTVAEDQLAQLASLPLSELRAELKILWDGGFLEEGFRLPGGYGWFWCTYRGNEASGTGINSVFKTGPSRLVRRRTFMAIRLELMRESERYRWLTRRMLDKGRSEGFGGEMAAVDCDGARIAIVLSVETSLTGAALGRRIARIRSEHDRVYWYCEEGKLSQARRILNQRAWSNVEVREVPGG